MPAFEGAPIRVSLRSELTTPSGRPGHAASDIRRRRVYIEQALLDEPAEFRRILTHELFHFVWVRLPNRLRWNWETVLLAEWRARAPGELGFSAEWRKDELAAADIEHRSRRWRDYACESFCDSAAWLYARAPSPEYTIALRWRRRRERWFRNSWPPGERTRL